MREPLFETIRPRTQVLGRRVIHYRTLPSTMDEARRLALEGAERGLVVVADEQTAGRGRLDRPWHSPPGSLLATVLLRPPPKAPTLPLVPVAAGVGLAESIQRLVRAPARLKWPNDVLIEGQKVAGILTEARSGEAGVEFILVGLGVNGNLRAEQFPLELRGQATSLSIWSKSHVCLPALLKVFLERFEARLGLLAAGRPDEVLAVAREHSVVLGRPVRVETTTGAVEGVALDFGPNGELVLATPDGKVTIDAGDCRLLRPVS